MKGSNLLDSGDGAKENAKVELPNSTWGKASDMLEHVDNTQDSQQVENTQDSKAINPAPYFRLVSLMRLLFTSLPTSKAAFQSSLVLEK